MSSPLILLITQPGFTCAAWLRGVAVRKDRVHLDRGRFLKIDAQLLLSELAGPFAPVREGEDDLHPTRQSAEHIHEHLVFGLEVHSPHILALDRADDPALPHPELRCVTPRAHVVHGDRHLGLIMSKSVSARQFNCIFLGERYGLITLACVRLRVVLGFTGGQKRARQHVSRWTTREPSLRRSAACAGKLTLTLQVP